MMVAQNYEESVKIQGGKLSGIVQGITWFRPATCYGSPSPRPKHSAWE